MTCANIGPAGRRQRRVFGSVMMLVAAAVAAWIIAWQPPPAWRTVVFVPLLLGSLGLLQARAQTCVVLAARGVRDPDTGIEPVASAAERDALGRQARRVAVQSLLIAMAGTAVLFALLS